MRFRTFPYFALAALVLASPLSAQRDSAHVRQIHIATDTLTTLDRTVMTPWCKLTATTATRKKACVTLARLHTRVDSLATAFWPRIAPAPTPVPAPVPPPTPTPTPTPIPTPVPIGTMVGPAMVAELPRATVDVTYPATGHGVRVPAGASLQAAINAAVAGDVLLLEPGASYVGNFTLPAKGASSSWIVIRTDTSISLTGTRLTPTQAASLRLAKILSPNNASTITTDYGAHHFRFTGVEISATSAATDINALIRFGSDIGQTTSNTAHDLIIDRSWVHGSPTLQVRRCVLLNSASSAVIDSWLGDCHSNVSDSQAIVGWNGPGPFLIQNNHLEAGHEVVVFGGGTFTVAGGSPSDITLRGNHLTRPLAWRKVWQVKNLLETKHVKRLLVEGNVFENNWVDAQAGFAFVLKSENQNNDNPWTQSADITIRDNVVGCTPNGINISAAGSNYPVPSVPAARITIVNNLFSDINGAACGTSNQEGKALQLLAGVQDLVFLNNTMLNAGPSNSAMVLSGSPAVTRAAFRGNVIYSGDYGVKGGGQGSGTNSLNAYIPGALWDVNAIIGAQCASYPATTSCPNALSAVPAGFGADTTRIRAATAGVVVAP